MKDIVHCDLKKFMRKLSLYLLITWFAFVITSGGWSMIGFLFYGGIFWVLVLCCSGLVYQSLKRKGRKSVSIDRTLLGVILILQFFSLILNIHDCGDNPVIYNFIQLVIAMKGICNQTETIRPLFAYTPVLQLIYLGFLFYGIGKTFASAKK